MTARLALAAAVLLAAGGPALAQSSFRRCNHKQNLGANIRIAQHMQLAWSDQGDGPPDAAAWDDVSTKVVERAWRGHWRLDQSNPAVFLGAAHTDHGFNSSVADFVSVLHKHTEFPDGIGGSTALVAFFDLISEVDIEVLGRTRDHVPATVLPVADRCALTRSSFGGVMVHELGHAYGFAHWFDWISMMNPGHVDTLSCEGPPTAGHVMNHTPDALTTQCHDIQYGLSAGVDFSGTPVRQTCHLANGPGCSSVLNTLTRYAPGTAFALVLGQFTSFSNRDSHAGSVDYRMVVSLDTRAGTEDREVGRGTLSNWGAGATITRTLGGRMNPMTDLPLAGREYMLLVELDPDHRVTETNEGNNVIDTLIRFVRD
jgi:hypothetical protein